ncbi:ATP-binding protein [Streptomyces subrutilus]|uniref:AlbA family DNA-binding domain-containing protein n=1 Tax=Streptomyces subrutilus TaxID=36818 RepID=UPI0034197669
MRVHWEEDDQIRITIASEAATAISDGPFDFEFDLTEVSEAPVSEVCRVLREIRAAHPDDYTEPKSPSLWVRAGRPDPHILSDIERTHEYLDRSHMSTVSFVFYVEEHETLAMSIYVQYPFTTDRADSLEIVGPYLSARGSVLLDFESFPHDNADGGINLDVSAPDHLRIGDCVALGQTLSQMLRFRAWNPGTMDGAHALLLMGKAEVLLGQPESEWLEAKRKGYGLQYSEVEKYEYARDLASFANSADGGILIVGVATDTDASGADVMVEVTPCKTGSLNTQTYAHVAHSKIVPPIEGLEISRVATGEGELLVIRIPPQAEYLKPFLVAGAIINDKVSGSFISIPQRRGTDKWNMSPAAVHSLLVAARVALRSAPVETE